VREALFSILHARGPAPERALDLYAGSGALGLEALSRGVGSAVFVDNARESCKLIGDNARELGLDDRCTIACSTVAEWLKRNTGTFGWIFADPPYAAGELDRALALVDEQQLLGAGGLAIAEHEWRTAPAESHGSLALYDRRRYGQTAISIYTSEKRA
jgi:16S rRNA (guanine(966)-N(2))-methyltransferase RsmD